MYEYSLGVASAEQFPVPFWTVELVHGYALTTLHHSLRQILNLTPRRILVCAFYFQKSLFLFWILRFSFFLHRVLSELCPS